MSAFLDAITCPVSKSVRRKPSAATEGAGGVTTAAFAACSKVPITKKANESNDGLAR